MEMTTDDLIQKAKSSKYFIELCKKIEKHLKEEGFEIKNLAFSDKEFSEYEIGHLAVIFQQELEQLFSSSLHKIKDEAKREARADEQRRCWGIIDNYLEQTQDANEFYREDRKTLKNEILSSLKEAGGE